MAAQKEVKKSVSGGEEGEEARICGIRIWVKVIPNYGFRKEKRTVDEMVERIMTTVG